MKIVIVSILTLIQFIIYYVGVYFIILGIDSYVNSIGWGDTFQYVIKNASFNYSVLSFIIIVGIELLNIKSREEIEED
jgi:hypothetical protein